MGKWTQDKINLDDSKLCAEGFLGGFGGMGSLNDIYLSKQYHQKIDEFGESWVNTLLINLLSLNASLSENILSGTVVDENQIRGVEWRNSSRIIGYECKKCKKRYINRSQLDSFIASNTLNNLLISALMHDEFEELLLKSLKGSFVWADEKRRRFVTEMKRQRIEYIGSESDCPKYGNKTYSVFYWDSFSHLQRLQFSSRFDVNQKKTYFFSRFLKETVEYYIFQAVIKKYEL